MGPVICMHTCTCTGFMVSKFSYIMWPWVSDFAHTHTPQSKTAGGGLPVTEDQEKLLTEALGVVKKNSFEMKTCLVSGVIV